MTEVNYSVLVLDGQWRQALSVTRSLGKKGIRVIVGDSSKIAISKFSKYCSESLTYPEPVKNPDRFVEFILDYIKNNKIDLIIPASEPTVELLSRHKQEIEKHSRIPLAGYDTVVNALDKSLTFKAAAESGIPCPVTYSIQNESEIIKLADALAYPVIIKPRRSTGALGYREVASKEDFIETYAEIHATYKFPIVQEYIPNGGGKFSFGAILDGKGGVKAAFVHSYLRQLPYEAGVGTLTCSEKNDAVKESGLKLLKHLGWYGIAEVEFKMDPRDNLPKLLEINPRFWGMSENAVCAGMDLPFHLFEMTVKGDMKTCSEYRTGQYLRWLFPGDILHYISNPERGKIKHFFNFFDKNTNYYILSKDDPMPVFGVMAVSIVGIFVNEEIKLFMKDLFGQIFSKFKWSGDSST